LPKFVFKLEGVLRQRKNAEQQRQREVAVVQGQLTLLQNELTSLNDAVRAGDEDLRQNRLTGKLDLAYLAAHRRFTLAMQRKAVGLTRQINAQAIKVAEAQLRLTEAVKKRKAIEKLREKYLERWREAMVRSELHELDEIAMQMSRRQMLEDQDDSENLAAEQAGAA
jgi:flagellar export protein FliJ